ncbi:MAG: hypothetical protein ACOC12_06590 [Bacteroidota bacterium]
MSDPQRKTTSSLAAATSKTAILLLLMFLCPPQARSQSTNFLPGYAITNGEVRLEGRILFNPQTPGFVSLREFGGDITTYTAAQLQSFQILGQNEYVSRTIIYHGREQKVFLEKSVAGEFTYLYLKHKPDRYFLEMQDGSLTEITTDNFVAELSAISPGCTRLQSQLPHTRLHHEKMRFLVRQINRNKCRNIPFSSLGLSAGATFAIHTFGEEVFSNQLVHDAATTHNSYRAGFFWEKPVWTAPVLSIRYGAAISSHSTYTEYFSSIQMAELHTHRTDLMLTVEPSLALNTFSGVRPYLLAGPVAVINLAQDAYIIDTQLTPEGSETNTFELEMAGLSPGISLGAGIRFFYQPHRFISIEVKNTHLFFEQGHRAEMWQIGVTGNLLNY